MIIAVPGRQGSFLRWSTALTHDLWQRRVSPALPQSSKHVISREIISFPSDSEVQSLPSSQSTLTLIGVLGTRLFQGACAPRLFNIGIIPLKAAYSLPLQQAQNRRQTRRAPGAGCALRREAPNRGLFRMNIVVSLSATTDIYAR